MSESLEHEVRTLRALYWSPRDPEGRGFASLADVYRRKGDLDEAEALVRDGLGRLPDFATGHLVAARVARAREDLDGVEEHLERVLTLDPENVSALVERAVHRIDRGDGERARDDVEAALALQPAHPEALERLRELEGRASEGRQAEDVDAVVEPELDVDAFPEGGADAEELEIDGEFDVDGFLDGGGFEIAPDAEVTPDAELTSAETTPDAEIAADIDAVFDPPEAARSAEEPIGHEPADETELGGFELEGIESMGMDIERTDDSREADDSPESEPRPDRSLFTRTMGDLYARQGLTDRALEVFEHLLEQDPGNPGLSARLEQLRAAAGPDALEVDPDPTGEVHVEDAPIEGVTFDEPATASPLEEFATEERVEEIEEPAVEEPAEEHAVGEHAMGLESAPSARTVSDGEPGRTIEAYLNDLLAWQPGAVPIESLAPEGEGAAAVSETHSRAEEEAGTNAIGDDAGDSDENLDDFNAWLDGFGR